MNSDDFVLRLLKTWKEAHARYVSPAATVELQSTVDEHFRPLLQATLLRGRLLDPIDLRRPLLQSAVSTDVEHVESVEAISRFEVQTNLLLRAGSFTEGINYGRRYIGPLVWELLFHVLVQNKQNRTSEPDYLRLVFATFNVCVCGYQALAFLAQIESHVPAMNTETLLYVMHEQSKLGSYPSSFRNFLFGYPTSLVFVPRATFADTTAVVDDSYLLVVLQHRLFGVPQNLESLVQTQLTFNNGSTRMAVLQRFAASKVLSTRRSSIDHMPYLTQDVGLGDKLALLLLVYSTYLLESRVSHRMDYQEAVTTVLYLFQLSFPTDSVETSAKVKVMDGEENNFLLTFERLCPMLNICVVMATKAKYSLYDVILGLGSRVTSTSVAPL